MNYNILDYVIAVAEEKSFTKAAKKLYITQPSLSQIIKSEEEKLGLKLFDRSQNPISLTDAGKEYILWARQVISIHSKMLNRLDDFSNSKSTVLKIGALAECSSFILSKPLKDFTKKNPKSYVEIVEKSSHKLQNGLDNSEFDFIISLTPGDTFKYNIEPLYNENIVLAVTPEFAPAEKDIETVDLSKYSDAPFVVMTKNGFLYDLTHELCKRSGFVPKSVVECSDLQTAMHMVKSGVGVSIIPDLMSHIIGGLDYYNIDGDLPQSQVSVIYNKDSYLTQAARDLIHLIKENLTPLKRKAE